MKGRTPTKKESDYMDLIRDMGCIVCILENKGHTPPQIHHIDGKTKPDAHMRAIPLCYCHHMADQQQPKNELYTSRHPHKSRFEERYGSEAWLLEQTQKHLEAYKLNQEYSLSRKYAKRVDDNQKEIVKLLRSIPGVTVALDHDDIFVGYRGNNYWYEIKNKNGKNRKQESQKKLEREWQGHYRIVHSIDQILEDIKIT